MKKGKSIYLDYAASTPVNPRVFAAMKPYLGADFGNPGSLHSFGQAAMAAVDSSREIIAKAIGAGFREIIFTGSATEANNLVLRGLARVVEKPRIVVSAIEHDSILETARDLEKRGVEVVYLPVSREGRVDFKKLKESLNERTVLVSVMYANNEVGVIQPISKIADIIREYRAESGSWRPFFHTDAVQALQFLDCDVNKLGVDFMTLSAHKIYGPKGIGLLYGKATTLGVLKPAMTGGGQEFGFRSGTENVAGLVGFAKAVKIAIERREERVNEVSKLRKYFLLQLKKIYPGVIENGSERNDFLPSILNTYFPDYKAEELSVALDLKGVAVSAGSACSARSLNPSHVIQAMFHSEERAKRSLRFSFGEGLKRVELDRALRVLAEIFKNK